MSLGVNTNISSLTAQRALASADKDLSTSMERLSTGKRINTASDDAAGMAVATRLTAQINGLNAAVKNANSAIALTQTIDGALVQKSVYISMIYGEALYFFFSLRSQSLILISQFFYC